MGGWGCWSGEAVSTGGCTWVGSWCVGAGAPQITHKLKTGGSPPKRAAWQVGTRPSPTWFVCWSRESSCWAERPRGKPRGGGFWHAWAFLAALGSARARHSRCTGGLEGGGGRGNARGKGIERWGRSEARGIVLCCGLHFWMGQIRFGLFVGI